MYVTKRFLVGITLATVAGLLAAAAQASVTREYDQTPLTVPVGRIGDSVTYATFEKGRVEVGPQRWPVVYSGLALTIPKTSSSQTNGNAAPAADWGAPTFAGSKVVKVGPAVDATGMIHDVVHVASNGTGRTGQMVVELVDLETRQVIRTDWKTGYGSVLDVSSNYEIHTPELFGLPYQGQTFALGDDLSALNQVPDWVDAGKDAFSTHSKVERRSLVNGIDAYGIRTEMSYRQGALSDTPAAGPQIRMTIVEDTFVGDEIPYPLLVHRYVTWVSGDTSQSYEVIVSLVEYVPGTTAIPWGQDRATDHFRSSNVEIERTQGSRLYPDEGTGRQLSYPLTQAIQDVEGDKTLVRFQQWRSSNSNSVLVGALLQRDYSSSQVDAGAVQWTLTWAIPSGEYYQVRTGHVKDPVTSTTSTIKNDDSSRKGLPFDPLDIPAHPVTLGAADALWFGLAGNAYREQANFVSWGLPENPYNVPMKNVMRRLTYGYSGADGAVSKVRIDTETGNIQAFTERYSNFQCTCFKMASAQQRPDVVAKTVPAGVTPPRVEEAAVTTTASVGVFLVVYFLPVLQFFGAQAFVAGFAKLRKEDILDNRLRDQILHLIKAEPGIHASDIARRVEAGWGTIVYHLSVLERNKLVSSLVDGRHKRFFPIGVVDFSRRGQLAVLRNTTTKTIFEMIASDPGIIQGTVAGRSQLSVPAAIWHLKRLEEAGLVGRAKEGRRVHYFANKEEDVPVPYDERDSMEIV